MPGLACFNEKKNAFLELVEKYGVYLQADCLTHPRENDGYLIWETDEGFCPANLQAYIDSIAHMENVTQLKGFDSVKRKYYEVASGQKNKRKKGKHDVDLMTREYVRAMYFNLQVS